MKGFRFEEISTKKKGTKSAVFEGEKSLDVGKGVEPRTSHPIKK